MWNLRWGAVSSNSMGLSGGLLFVGSMGGEDEGADGIGSRSCCDSSRAGERRGLGGTGRSVFPGGKTASKAGTDDHICIMGNSLNTNLSINHCVGNICRHLTQRET